ncbi:MULTISPECIES: glycosyltransferase [unclassified Roseitalea]|uniref:glycosyltransferase n=1 Tax=unclassified Roseitalea TaxID=2639107 RepID=UPI00273E89AA|nr:MULTISPECIES: glycosyltransferase [unclassified Roseitalea]
MIDILLPDLRGGGVERIRLVLAEEFVRQGYAVSFVLLQARGQLLAEAEARFPVRSLGCARMRQAPLRLTRYLREQRPDALLAAMWPLTGIAGLAARLSGYRGRLVASEHVDFRITPSLKAFERRALKRFGRRIYAPCHRVIAVSDGVAESLRAVAGVPRNQIEVIHNPVRLMAPDTMTDEDRRALNGWLAGETRLIAVGTLKRQKGYDVLLHALAELRRHHDARLLILGEGSLRNDLEALARDLGVANSLWMPGFRPNPVTFLQQAHVFVLSSNWEGFGNVIVEALAAGVPVVSTDCPSGPAEILSDGDYGRLVPVGDPGAIARAVAATLRDRWRNTDLKARAADFAAEEQAAHYLRLLADA